MRKPRALLLLAAIAAVVPLSSQATPAKTYEIKITNLTRGQILSPPVIAWHGQGARMFRLGRRASPGLAALAEDADSAPLGAELSADAKVSGWIAGTAPILPGSTASYMIDADSDERLSLVSMLVTTNDAFAGLDSYQLSMVEGRVRLLINAYDSGSERNNESCAFIPGPPCGNGGVRDTKGREGYVHVHAGIRGDGDVDATTYDWHNPVALVEIIER